MVAQGFLTHHDVHDLEAAADDARAAEVAAYFSRRGIGGDIEIAGSAPISRSRTAPPTT